MINPDTNEELEIDVFLPNKRLAFEFQERHHFVAASNLPYQPLNKIQERDAAIAAHAKSLKKLSQLKLQKKSQKQQGDM